MRLSEDIRCRSLRHRITCALSDQVRSYSSQPIFSFSADRFSSQTQGICNLSLMVSPISSVLSSLPYLLADLPEHALFPVPIVYPVYLRYQFSAFRHIIQFVVNVEQTSEQFALLVDIRQLVRVFLTYPDCIVQFRSCGSYSYCASRQNPIQFSLYYFPTSLLLTAVYFFSGMGITVPSESSTLNLHTALTSSGFMI